MKAITDYSSEDLNALLKDLQIQYSGSPGAEPESEHGERQACSRPAGPEQ